MGQRIQACIRIGLTRTTLLWTQQDILPPPTPPPPDGEAAPADSEPTVRKSVRGWGCMTPRFSGNASNRHGWFLGMGEHVCFTFNSPPRQRFAVRVSTSTWRAQLHLIIFGAHSLQAPPLPQLPEMPDHNASLSSMSWWSSDGTSFHAIVATGVGMSTRTLVSPCDDLPLFALVQRSAVRARLKPSSD